ncbi:MAG: arsenate reductase (glutaredoxin) [Alphaproteobacteria bacterium]
MQVTIYHNPKCETSRNALAIIRGKGIEPTIIEYLKTPLDQHELRHLIDRMKVPVKDVVRWKQKDEVAAAGISEATDEDTLLAAMAAHPVLMNRPIVITPKGTKLCRPSETVSQLLN